MKKELLADKIRKYCNETHIIPARDKGAKIVKIRAGDIKNEMSLQNRVPAICSALQALKFETYANVKRISIDGPGEGMDCVMTFEILESSQNREA